MTKQELLQRLQLLAKTDAKEDNHIIADNLLLTYINDVEIKNAFSDIDKWYA